MMLDTKAGLRNRSSFIDTVRFRPTGFRTNIKTGSEPGIEAFRFFRFLISILLFLVTTGFAAYGYEFDKLISKDDPYYDCVLACYRLGVIYEEEGADVRMEQSMNRYQVAHVTVMTLEKLGITVAKDPSNLKYHDVPASHWAAADVSGCVNLGLMGGFEDLTFQGRSNMMKEHWLAMCSVLADKFAAKPTPEAAQIPPKFRDLPTINWLWQPINTLARYGWLDPDVMDDDFLNRNDSVTRKILYWYLGKLVLSIKGPVDAWPEPADVIPEVEVAVVVENDGSQG